MAERKPDAMDCWHFTPDEVLEKFEELIKSWLT